MRTIQRDLKTLSAIFPLLEDDQARPYGWSWARDAKVLDIPGMEPPAALTFHIAENFLSAQLPLATVKYLQPHFQRAREVLNSTTADGYRSWTDKVRILPRGLPLMPAEVNDRVQNIVYQALFEERRFQAGYRPRGQDGLSEYEVNPLGLVFRQGVTYLVATLWEYDDVVQLALHRFQHVELLEDRASVPDGFDLDDYISQGEFEYPMSARFLRLRLRFDEDAAFHLNETPLSEDQTIEACPGGKVEVRATVKDTLELRWWLLGFGGNVEVLGPAALRREFLETARKLQEIYFPSSTPPE